MDYDDGAKEQFYCPGGIYNVNNSSFDDAYEPEEGELISVVFGKKSRIVKEPSLEILRGAPASPHVDANLSYKGYYHKTNEGQWLRLKDNIEPTYIWIGKDATISRLFKF